MDKTPKMTFDNINAQIEKTANYEGNETLLLQSRMQNPEIKKQLIDTYYEFYVTRENDGSQLIEKEEIERNLEETIKEVFNSTEIDFSERGSSHGNNSTGTVRLFTLNPETKVKWTQKQLSITEAHEKGHILRSFDSPGKSFESKIHSGFDFSNLITKETEDMIRKEKQKGVTEEVVKQALVDYYTFPMELMERMSQLKNYFGMKGAEKFSKAHLDYAKAHYISDTGTPKIQMQPFLDAITSKTESRFLELINTLGI